MPPVNPDPISELQVRLSTLDRSIIELAQQRAAIARQLTVRRRSADLSVTQLSWERVALSRCREALGQPGTEIALHLLWLEPHEPARTARPAPTTAAAA
jgi:chorismate mutase